MSDTVSEDVKPDDASVVKALRAAADSVGMKAYYAAKDGADDHARQLREIMNVVLAHADALDRTTPIAWEWINKADGERQLHGEPPADLPFNRERWTWHPLYASPAYLAATKPPLADVTVKALFSQLYDWFNRLPGESLGKTHFDALIAIVTASPPMPGRGEGFVLVPVELTDEMIRARWPSYHPWGQNAPPPEDRPSMYAEMVEKTKALWAVLLASRPGENELPRRIPSGIRDHAATAASSVRTSPEGSK